MITLFQFPAAFNVPNASPYCLKLETWLRLAGLEYQVKVVSDPRKAPKGKLPYVRIEGEAIGDSEIVIRTLGERYGVTRRRPGCPGQGLGTGDHAPVRRTPVLPDAVFPLVR